MENDYVFDPCAFKGCIAEVEATIGKLSDSERKAKLSEVFTCIDNTTLNGSDSQLSVETFCRATREMYLTDGKQSHVASVCVYPRFVGVAKKELENSGINVASVAGGFPAGQTPQRIKTEEVKYVVEEGADEVDFVINRGDFLTGNTKAVFDEVAEAKEVCGNSALLKVIIETGELQTPENVYNASRLVLDAGADFVKTSTGKIPVGATPEAAYVMLLAVRDYIKISKKTVGFKAAGGISNPSDALIYYLLHKKILGKEITNNQNFRIGASRLTSQLFKFLS